jgi:hypothetical protein
MDDGDAVIVDTVPCSRCGDRMREGLAPTDGSPALCDSCLDEEQDSIKGMDGQELLQAYLEKHGLHCLEGESALKQVEGLLETIGYSDTGFRLGSPIESFLCDNSGAVEAILGFIGEWVDRNADWREALEDDLLDAEDEES